MGKNIPEQEIRKREISQGINIIELIFQKGLVKSKSEARRAIKGGAIKINNQILSDENKIILLDEATSSLDSETEQQIQEALSKLTYNKTTIVIAHRLSTIIRANKIIVLNQGKIVDIGTHNDLLKNSLIYKNLYSKQLSA